jgi:hypothetical protein
MSHPLGGDRTGIRWPQCHELYCEWYVRREDYITVLWWNDGEEAGYGISGGDDEVTDVLRIAQASVGVFSIWFILSGSFCVFVILGICHSASFGFYG